MPFWAKLYTDILSDPKLTRAARDGARNLELLPWFIAYAKRADDSGRLSIDGFAARPEDIAEGIPCVTRTRVAKSLDELEKIGVLARDPDNVFRFVTWDARQSDRPSDSRDARAERQRKHREQKKLRQQGRSAPVGLSAGGHALHAVTDTSDVTAVTRDVTRQTEREREEADTRAKSESGDASPRSVPSSVDLLLARVAPEKLAKARAEVAKLLNGGLVYGAGGTILQATPERLAAKCSETLDAMRRGREVRCAWSYVLARVAAPDDATSVVWVASDSQPGDVLAVLDHYTRTHPGRRVGPEDETAVKKALTSGYSVGDLCVAIDGNAGSEWHRKEGVHALTHTLGTTGRIDDFRGRADKTTPERAFTARAATLWLLYREHGMNRNVPLEERERVGAELVLAGTVPTVAEFVDDMRWTKPWTLEEVRSDQGAVEEITRRLAGKAEYEASAKRYSHLDGYPNITRDGVMTAFGDAFTAPNAGRPRTP